MGVFKKKNRWYADFYIDGKRKCEVVKIKGIPPEHVNRQDALKYLAIKKAEIAQGVYIAQKVKPVPFEKLTDSYLEWAGDNHRAPERDRAACKALLTSFQGKNIYSLALFDIEKYKSARKKQSRSPETINKELGILRRMFNLALTGALNIQISKNPVQGLKLLTVPERKHRVLKDWEFQKLYGAASNHFKPILLCAYVTGMRRDEIRKLRWNEVDLDYRRIHVIETKNDESRSIPIDDSLHKTLSDMRARASGEFVFTGPTGKPYISLSAWKSAWSAALKKSGIDKCRFHDLRHTFVSNLIVGEKEDFATVMSLSGHKDIKMLKRYSHTREEAKEEAIKKLGRRVNIADYSETSPAAESKPENIVDINKRKH